MPLNLDGWSVLGIAAAIAIALGFVLLVVYALRRGLTNSELDGTIAAETASETPPPARDRENGRTLGVIGAVVLIAGLGLGILAATTRWGSPDGGMGPGNGPVDCAQSWNGCPQGTPARGTPAP